MKNINTVSTGDYVTDGNGEFAEVKIDEQNRKYYANREQEDIPENEEIITVSDLDEDHLN